MPLYNYSYSYWFNIPLLLLLLPCYWTIATTAVWFSYYSDWVNAVVWTKDIQKFTTKHKIVCKEGRIPYFPLVLARIIENHHSVKTAVFIRTLRKTFNDKKSRKLRKTEKLRCEVNINPFSTFDLYTLNTSENQRFSDVSRGYRSGILVENGLNWTKNLDFFLKFLNPLL